MKIIAYAVLFMIAFYSIGKIGYIVNSVKSLLYTQNQQINFMWFTSILLINIILITFTIWYYYHIKNNSFGPSGPKGYPGLPGNDTECLVCDN